MPASTPIAHWIGFHLFVLILLAAEYLLAAPQRRARLKIDDPTPPYPTDLAALITRLALRSTALWVAAALAFAVFLFFFLGHDSAIQYLAGYSIEEALSIDNLFVFLLLFRLFQIAPQNQPRVLFWGVAGAIVMRGAFIAAGIGLLARFHWISYVFALILLAASIRLLMPGTETDQQGPPRWIRWVSRIHPVSLRQDTFLTVENGQRMATMLLLALIAIEVTDVVFALDSIPAVLSITRHPFLAYTSNIMAVMGLRSLFFLLAHLLQRLRYLHYGLAAVLAFAALKMLSAPWLDIGPLTSLAVIMTLLAFTISLSLLVQKAPAQART